MMSIIIKTVDSFDYDRHHKTSLHSLSITP